jgi:hypothetical protein
MPSRIELASAAAVLLLILLMLLSILALRALSRRRARHKVSPFGIADTHDVFIADKTRNVPRPAPLPEAMPTTHEPPTEAAL